MVTSLINIIQYPCHGSEVLGQQIDRFLHTLMIRMMEQQTDIPEGCGPIQFY